MYECPDPQHDCYVEIGFSGVNSAGVRSSEWNSDPPAPWPKKRESHLPAPGEDTAGCWLPQPRRDPHQETQPVGTLPWTFQPPEDQEDKFLLFEPPRRWYFVIQPETTKTAFIGGFVNKRDKNVLWNWSSPGGSWNIVQSVPTWQTILAVVYWVVEARHCALWAPSYTYSLTQTITLSPQSSPIRLIAFSPFYWLIKLSLRNTDQFAKIHSPRESKI